MSSVGTASRKTPDPLARDRRESAIAGGKVVKQLRLCRIPGAVGFVGRGQMADDQHELQVLMALRFLREKRNLFRRQSQA